VKIDTDGLYKDFCCSSLEYYTKHPLQCVIFDPFYKKFDGEEGEQRACIFTKETGVSKKEREGKMSSAGRGLVGISYCPFCGAQIIFG
jgi:hypothetical protein